MKLSELSTETGVSTASLKYYLRESLLAPGEPVRAVQEGPEGLRHLGGLGARQGEPAPVQELGEARGQRGPVRGVFPGQRLAGLEVLVVVVAPVTRGVCLLGSHSRNPTAPG